jgi:hypothetical protein
VIYDLLINGHATCRYVCEVLLDIGLTGLETVEGGELFGNAGCEGCWCAVFDVAEEFFGFFGLYCGKDVKQCFACFGVILKYGCQFFVPFIWEDWYERL